MPPLAPTAPTTSGSAPPTPVPAPVPLEVVERELCRLAAQLAAGTSRYLLLLADFDARDGWAVTGVRSCAHWLSWRVGVSLATARDQLRVAHSLTALPRTTEAFSQGRLSYSKVRAICRVADPATEADLVEAGLHAPAAHLDRLVRGLSRCADTEQVEERAAAAAAAAGQQRPAWAPAPPPAPRFGLTWRWDDDGALRVSGRLAPEDGAVLLASLQSCAALEAATTDDEVERVLAAPEDDPAEAVSPVVHRATLPAAVRSSTVVALARAARAGLPHVRGADRTAPVEVVVHAGVDVLAGRREPSADPGEQCHLDDGPGLLATTVQRLACDGGVRLTLEGSDGRTMDVGRRRRRPTLAQVAALLRRDRCCIVPGCGRRAFLHAHHVLHWARGGTTSLDNLVLLCGEHHRGLHEGHLDVVALGRQRFRVVDRHGEPVRAAPPLAGTVGGLRAAHDDVPADALAPDWDGAGLDLRGATNAYRAQWAAAG